MKKLKLVILALALFAVPVGFAFSRYTTTIKLWEFNGTGQVLNPQSYQQTDTSPGCEGTAEICTVSAPDDGMGHPVFSTALKSRIQNKDISQGDVTLRD